MVMSWISFECVPQGCLCWKFGTMYGDVESRGMFKRGGGPS